jgi:hypothetical protein
MYGGTDNLESNLVAFTARGGIVMYSIFIGRFHKKHAEATWNLRTISAFA